MFVQIKLCIDNVSSSRVFSYNRYVLITTKMKKKDNKCDELCPQCDTEVKLDNKFELQQCPNCQCPILPCGICLHETDGTKPAGCSTCPLDEVLKDAWIEKLMQTVYQDDDAKYYDSNVRYLSTKTTFELSMLYQDWNDSEEDERF